MKKTILCLCLLLLTGAGLQASPVAAVEITPFEMAFNVNGAIYDNFYDYSSGTIPSPASLPPGMNAAGFNLATGLGTLTWATSTPGSYSFFSFFDHEIDETTNTYFNETARAHGSPPAYNPAGPWFWQMEDPGWNGGDLYHEFSVLNYENKNAFIDNNGIQLYGDVGMGIGRKFDLAAGQQAIITLTLGQTPPASGWYLEQFDPDSHEFIFFSADFTVQGAPVPLPGTLLLLGSGLAAMAGLRLRLRK
jgi:hypothetical protein